MANERSDTRRAIDLDEAARRLGVARASVRMAINRGFLKGFQDEEGRWRVYLDRTGEAVDAPSAETAGAAELPTSVPGLASMTMSVETVLADQVDFLRGQLEKRDATVSAKDALIAELSARLAKLGRSAVDRLGPPPRFEAPPARAEEPSPTALQDQQQRTLRNIADTLLLLRNHLERQRARSAGDR